MNYSVFIALGGFLIALVSLITGFILQRDNKKIRELERLNKKYKTRLGEALNAIKGYQQIEKYQAIEANKEVADFRKKIRKKYSVDFNTKFLIPKNIKVLISELEKE